MVNKQQKYQRNKRIESLLPRRYEFDVSSEGLSLISLITVKPSFKTLRRELVAESVLFFCSAAVNFVGFFLDCHSKFLPTILPWISFCYRQVRCPMDTVEFRSLLPGFYNGRKFPGKRPLLLGLGKSEYQW